ncbi:MAG: D-xylose ABC transporter ATP-binding protein, partial [Gammaproteobacteria bacterium]|nr:D-xylose ABC transporter ATP-binding protein [Gammaproteobacteria bacterium]
MRRQRARQVGIVYVSHRLDEIFKVCNRIMVLKDGRVTAAGDCGDFDHDKVTAAMVGRELGEMFPPKADDRELGATVIKLENLRPKTGKGARGGVSCSVRAGEIVALAGLVGSGRTAIAEAVFGLREAHGQVVLQGELFDRRTPAAAIAKRLLMLPENRKEDGLFPGAAVAGNIVATTLGRHAAWCLPRRSAKRR